MRVLDLFSGVGGFSLGLERAGMETVAFCEIDKYCQKVLNKHWPDVPIYEDVRSLDYDGSVELICGGFPCQPFSVAGNRKGKEDDRHLWPAMFSLIQKHRPRWVIGENVAGFINMALDDVLAELESEDYRTTSFIIPACAVNAPHRRDRVWIVANSPSERCNDGGDNWEERPVLHHKHRDAEKGEQERQGWQCGSSETGEDVANAESKQSSSDNNRREQGRVGDKEQSESRGGNSGGVRECHWSVEPGVGRVADGIPDRVDRLKALGNAVVPQIPEIIGRAIMEIENG